MITEVPYTQVLEIRHKVMYPEMDTDFVKLEDDNKGLHIGYHKNDVPVSVASLFLDREKHELQFRKLATLADFQNRGYASALIKWIVDYAKDMQFERVWCNARSEKIGFYKQFGFSETGETFEKNGFQYSIVELKK